mmetsp:Transcript_34390/g.33997  ORF Transcript_34390/g.33997 Transcript_34390/m.33997 type:complete len:84 (+) Transcript_34390:248-499(+)
MKFATNTNLFSPPMKNHKAKAVEKTSTLKLRNHSVHIPNFFTPSKPMQMRRSKKNRSNRISFGQKSRLDNIFLKEDEEDNLQG